MKVWDGPAAIGPVAVTDIETGSVVEMDGLCECLETPDMQGPDCVDAPSEPYAAYGIDIDFSPDGGMVAMGERSILPGRVWDSTTGETLASWVFNQGEFTPDGSRFVTIDHNEGLFEVRDTADFSVVATKTLAEEEPAIDHLRVTADGETIVGVDYGINGLAFYDIEDLTFVSEMANLHESFIRHIEISDDGAMIATAGRDGFAKVWDIETGELLHEIHASADDRVQAVEFADDDKHLLVAVAGGPLAIYTLDVDELLGIARDRVSRGFNETECSLYFPDTSCPTLEEIRAG